MNNVFLIIALAVVFSRCSRPVDFDLEEVETQPVLISYAEANAQIQAVVSTTYPVTEYVFKDEVDYYPCPMQLWVNHNFQENMPITGGVHYSTYLPQPGDTLMIRAVFEGDTISAETIVPHKAQILDFNYQEQGFISDDGTKLNIVALTLTDPAGEQNFYELYLQRTLQSNGEQYQKAPYYYETNDPVILNERQMEFEPRTLLISDQLFNGQEVSLSVAFSGAYLKADEELLSERFYVVAVSESYYRYKKSLYRHLFKQSNDVFWQSFSEPESAYTGVENGWGVFGAYAVSSVKLQNHE